MQKNLVNYILIMDYNIKIKGEILNVNIKNSNNEMAFIK